MKYDLLLKVFDEDLEKYVFIKLRNGVSGENVLRHAIRCGFNPSDKFGVLPITFFINVLDSSGNIVRRNDPLISRIENGEFK